MVIDLVPAKMENLSDSILKHYATAIAHNFKVAHLFKKKHQLTS